MSNFLPKILIVAPSWIGDAVMSQPLLQALMPASIDILAPAWVASVYERMKEVQTVRISPFKHGELSLFQRWHMAKDLKQHDYDQAIILPNSLKSALIPWFAGISKRTGYLGEMRHILLNDIYHLDKQLYPRMVDQFYRLARPDTPPCASVPSLVANIEQQNQLCQHLKIDPNQSWVALCPGAEYGEAKRWPADYFGKLAQKLIQKGLGVLVIGSKKDQIVEQKIQEYLADTPKHLSHLLCGKTSVAEAIDLLGLAHTVVCNDSGLMHIAAALDKKVVAIYGSSSPIFTPPLCDRHKVVSLDLECSPCFKRTCPLGHLNCLRLLDVDTVYQSVFDD
jgi:heptosyltransferase-2